MKTTRQYLSGCTWCNGTGFVKQPNSAFMSISLTIICPVCNGGKTVIVTETVDQEPQNVRSNDENPLQQSLIDFIHTEFKWYEQNSPDYGVIPQILRKWDEITTSQFTQQRQVSDVQQIMDDILEWSNRTFINESSYSKIKHLEKEVDELEKAIFHEHSKSEIEMEFADCFMLLLASAKMEGMTVKRLIEVTREKLEINKKRKWGSPDENGVVEHIKE